MIEIIMPQTIPLLCKNEEEFNKLFTEYENINNNYLMKETDETTKD